MNILRRHKYLYGLLLMSIGSVFGGIRCVGWNFPFPHFRRTEALARHISELSVQCQLPALPLTAIQIFTFHIVKLLTRRCDDTLPVTITHGIRAFMYAFAKLVLRVLGQPIATLRHQPPSVLSRRFLTTSESGCYCLYCFSYPCTLQFYSPHAPPFDILLNLCHSDLKSI